MDGRSTGKLTSELNDFKVIRKKKNDVLNKLSITAKEDPIAQFHLGAIYYSGDGVEQNYEEAAKWFTKSAQQGHSQAQYNLAAMYEDGEGVKQNIDEALKWYKKSAEQGNKDAIEALKELGYEINDSLKQDTDKLYENSIITLQDNEAQGSMEESIDLYNLGIQEYNQKKFFKALNFFTKSAELGNSLAQYYLGRMYAEGQAVKQDIEEAKKWYKTSSLNGCEVAKKALKNIEINIKNNIPTVKQEKLTSKEDKNQGAVDLYNLGLQDYNQKRFFKALNSFTKSAELGNPLSQYYLGVMYSEGKAVKQDIEEAKKWFRKSSEQGNQDSLKALKKLSTEIKKEPVTSEEQYQFASDYYKEKIYSEAFKWFTKSAEQGNNNALYYLGIMYQKGEGVEKNLDEAKKYYKKSSLGGCLEAKTALDELENNIKDVSNINNTKKENVKKQQEESKKISQNKESVELYNLGVQDYKQKRFFKALNYFTKSAEMGNPLAQYYLGIMYAQGKSVKPDIGEAKKWFQKSSLSGCKEAQKALDKLESIKVKEPVNEKKEESQKVVSVSLKKDTHHSQEYKTKSDDTTALYSLAINYYNSKEPNYKEAFICFLQAAEKGNIKAQYNLAVMYEDGLGVPEDRQEAIKWYKKAAEQGDKDAIEALQELENLENQNDKEDRGYSNSINLLKSSELYTHPQKIYGTTDINNNILHQSIYNSNGINPTNNHIFDYYKINDIYTLNYNDSLEVIKYICKISEDYNYFDKDLDIEQIKAEIKKHEEQVKEIKEGKAGCSNVVGIIGGIIALIAWIMIKTGSDVGLDFGCIAILLMMLGGIITFFSKVFGKKGLEKKANEYIESNISPLRAKLAKMNSDKQEFLQKEEAKWAIRIVGEGIFFDSSAPNCLKTLLEEGKANNLQEAISIYKNN